jgi:precorrin-2 dehydrogenase / sirohydrochlorin ferrochelatase
MSDPSDGPALYPAFFDLTGRLVVVVGGGEEAERRARGLHAYGADVVVVAEETTEELGELQVDGGITIEQREWLPADLEGALLVIAATGSPEGDAAVAAAANGRGILVRAIQSPEASSLFVPAVVRRGALQIALTTSGASAAVTKRVRARLADEFGEEWGPYLELVAAVRDRVRTSVDDSELGQSVFDVLVEDQWLERIARGESPDVEDVLAEARSRASAEAAEPGATDATGGPDAE